MSDAQLSKNEIKKKQKQVIPNSGFLESNSDAINAQQTKRTTFGLAQGQRQKFNDANASSSNEGLAPGFTNGDTLQYPQELYTKSQPHGVHFYINARQTSVAAEQAVGEGADMAALIEANAEYNKDYTQENRSKAENYTAASAGAGALAAALGVAAGIASGSILSEGATMLGKIITTAGSAVLGAAAGAAFARNTSTIRLLKSIQLHVPQSIISAYTANWDETSLGAAGVLGSGQFDLADLTELPEFATRGVISAAANIPKGIGGNADFGATLEATSKKVSNPYKEQLFKSVGFRRFAFNYNFAPRNLGEANMVLEIIDTFKYHMHPEVSDGNMFLIYPAEFSIAFEILDEGSGQVKTNPYLPKVSSCALTSVKATYGPDGMFNTFQGTDGIPTEMSLELQFTELETLTAVRIAQGF
jgi:hypothetical protein